MSNSILPHSLLHKLRKQIKKDDWSSLEKVTDPDVLLEGIFEFLELF